MKKYLLWLGAFLAVPTLSFADTFSTFREKIVDTQAIAPNLSAVLAPPYKETPQYCFDLPQENSLGCNTSSKKSKRSKF